MGALGVKVHGKNLKNVDAADGQEHAGRSGRGSNACPLCSDSDRFDASRQSAALCHKRSLTDLLDHLVGAGE